MRVPRLHLAQPLAPGAEVTLDAGTARHVTRVLRLRAGAELTLFNGDGHEYRARLVADDARSARAQVLADTGAPPTESPLHITLAQGIARGERMDYIVQKAVELGVRDIVPLLTERSVVRLQGARARSRRAHWQRVAIGACEQCGRVCVPEIAPPQTPASWLEATPPGTRWLLDPLAPAGCAPGDAAPEHVLLLIGPEGGLSRAEREQAHAAGFRPVRLGPRVLRTETATVAALTALQLMWGDLGGG